MITIEYCEDGVPISDFEYPYAIQTICDYCKEETSDLELRLSTSIIITAIRLEIAKGNIDYNKIKFQYKNKKFQANEYGVILDWPKGFCDIETDLCEQILRVAMEKRKCKS